MNWLSGSWSTVPTILDISKTLKSFVSFPFILRLPEISISVENGINPFIQLANVLFPEPEGPAIRTFSPSYIVKFMLFKVGFDWTV